MRLCSSNVASCRLLSGQRWVELKLPRTENRYTYSVRSKCHCLSDCEITWNRIGLCECLPEAADTLASVL